MESNELVPLLLEVMQSEKMDTTIRQQALAALQKLSLRYLQSVTLDNEFRRKAQSAMIGLGAVEWLLNILQTPDSISKYTLVPQKCSQKSIPTTGICDSVAPKPFFTKLWKTSM